MAAETWGDFEVFSDRILGRGGMGTVYLGRQISLDRPAAIKVLQRDLSSDPEFVKRFQREASLLAKLIHPHVVQIFSAGEIGGQHFFAMEYVEGEDLSAYLKREHRFAPEEVLRIGLQTAQALQAAWKQQIIHRDIKPSNIFVTRDNEIKVMDFGLAKSPAGELTMTTTLLGTAKYMSPEQSTGAPLDIRTDLYSLGAVLYELSTGKPPFTGDNPTAIVYQHVHKEPTPPRAIDPSIPEGLDALILKLLAKKPEERFQTPDELVEKLRDLLDLSEEITVPAEPSADPPPAPPPKTNWAALSVALLLGLGAIGAGGYYGWKRLNEAPIPSPESGNEVRVVPPTGRGQAAMAGRAVGRMLGAAPPAGVSEETEREFKEAVARGDAACEGGNWAEARTAYAEALALLSAEDYRREELQRKIDQARSEEITKPYREAVERGDQAALREDWVPAITAYKEARDLLPTGDPRRAEVDRKIEQARRGGLARGYEVAVARGDEAMGRKEWTTALAAYEEARKLLPEDDVRRSEIDSKIDHARKSEIAARYQEAVERGDRALGRGDWAGAITAYEDARNVLPEGDPRYEEVDRKIDRARREGLAKGFQDAVSRGDEALARKDWRVAVQAYEAALKLLSEEDARRAEIQKKIERARSEEIAGKYQTAVDRGDRALNRGDLDGAREAYEEALQALPAGDARRGEVEKKLERVAREEAAKPFKDAVARGDQAADRGDWTGALSAYGEALKLLPEGDGRRADVEAKIDRAKREAVAKQFEGIVERGDQASGRGEWAAAVAAYEEALALLPRDDFRRKNLEKQIDKAKFEIELEEAAKEPDLAKRLQGYRTLLRRNPDRLRPLVRATALDLAKDRIGNDWAAAAAALQTASEHSDDVAERKQLEEKKHFCERVGEALKAEAEKRWVPAKSAFESLLKGETFGWKKFLEDHLKSVEAKIAEGMTEGDKAQLEKFQAIVAQARKLFEAGEWKRANLKVGETDTETYRRFHDAPFLKTRELYRLAANPPSGMVFVPAGTYPIGDADFKAEVARHFDGPQWKTDLKPYFIDIREVTRAEYRAFLDVIKRDGHQYCHKEEPAGKRHIPERLEGEGTAVGVDWWDAYAYGAWRKKRLPTEYEFEVAAGYDLQSKTRKFYPWGDDFGDGTGTSSFGLTGLDNEVLEWTSSELILYPGSTIRFDKPGRRVLRGGYFAKAAEIRQRDLRVMHRHYREPHRRDGPLGFRCAQDVQP